MVTKLLLLFFAVTSVNGKIDLIHCRYPLGMHDKRIPDEDLIASSFHARGTGPKYARYNREEGDGAWCPLGVLYPEVENQWLQVKLPSLSFVSIIATQGRDSHGIGQEYTPSYKLNYSRDGENWFQWKNFRGDTVLGGNVDARGAQRQRLNPGIPSAAFVRFIPVTSNPMSVCARIELYGCEMTSGIVQYDAQRPGSVWKGMSDSWSFDDEFYDGRRERTTYHGGLGQLTDGVIGYDDVGKTRSSVASRVYGFDYVGWQNSKRGDRYVTLTFFFEDARNFTSMIVHCLSSSEAGSRFPSSVEISFSLDGRTFPNAPYASRVTYEVPDIEATEARSIVVPLDHALGRYVKARFQIRGDWLLMSEVEFDAAVVDRDPAPELMFPEMPSVPVLVLPVTVPPYDEGSPEIVSVRMSDEEVALWENEALGGGGEHNPTGVMLQEPTNAAVIGCSLAGVILLLVVVVIFLIYRHRRLKKTMTPPRYSHVAAAPSAAGPASNVTLCITDQRAAFSSACALPEKCAGPLYHEIAANGRTVTTTNEYLQPKDVVSPYACMPEVARLAHQSAERDRRFEQPDVTMCASGVRDGVMPVPYYAETAVRALPPPYATPLQGPFGNNVYAVPWTAGSPVATRRHLAAPPKYTATPSEASSLLVDEDPSDRSVQTATLWPIGERGAIEFPRERLEFVEKLGEGQFGEVRLCKADSSLRRCAEANGITISGGPNEPVLVAVKALRSDASPHAKEDFLKEVKVMTRLRDPNIVQLLAVCTEDEPHAMITEYAANGDLHEYLKGFEFDDATSQLPTISLDALLSMATQISSGMKYLSSLNFVHRDLATRNCLVDADCNIRIADFGMSRNMYQADYYKIQGKAVLPIRWMSWECVLLGKFSSASDVWAFGVTMWEIFTLCKCQPHHSLDDKAVIENMHHVYQKTGEEVYLPKPKACPISVFAMVRQCWKRECEERPGFELLHSFLKGCA